LKACGDQTRGKRARRPCDLAVAARVAPEAGVMHQELAARAFEIRKKVQKSLARHD
jgi:hypothetical protein